MLKSHKQKRDFENRRHSKKLSIVIYYNSYGNSYNRYLFYITHILLFRPDFTTIRNRLKPMRLGMKNNIMDQMVEMLEKYSNNLEDLVEERTQQVQTMHTIIA